MGKKRVAKKGESGKSSGKAGAKSVSSGKLARKRLEKGILHVQSTYNNTKIMLSETNGEAVAWSSSGALGFKGAKKGTPFAAAKIGEVVGEKAKRLGTKEVEVVVNGVGSGRESAIRAFLTASGSQISRIQDRTPIPFNGPRPRKARRV